MGDDLTELTATDLLAAYAAGRASPVEVADAYLDRIARVDGLVNAYCLVDPDTTRSQAVASEQRWRAGEPAGRLDGVPVAVKDVFLTEGWATLRGSATIDESGPWPVDAPAVAALRRHGAVLLGKTTTPEFAWKAVTDSPRHGITRNPWDPRRTAGGSSGGSSAALSAGTAPLALGTDGGGSIRIPCSFCNLAGIKPTYGRVPLWPPSPFGTLAHAGPMSRTVADSALLLAVLAEPDARDWTGLPPAGEDPVENLAGGVAGLRVAYSPTLGFATVSADVRSVLDGAAAVFEELGAYVSEVDPGFGDPLESFTTLWNAGAANALRHLDREQRTVLDSGLGAIVERAQGYSALDYLAAASQRAEVGVAMGRFHETYDLLLTPTVGITAFDAGRDVPDGWPSKEWPTWAPFSYVFNLSQQPAASVPAGFDRDGMPIGLQIVGPKYADVAVLRAAFAFERARPLYARRPSLEVA